MESLLTLLQVTATGGILVLGLIIAFAFMKSNTHYGYPMNFVKHKNYIGATGWFVSLIVFVSSFAYILYGIWSY